MKKTWPLVPDHITEIDNDNVSGFGIIDKEHLIGIITEDASHLKNPVTIIEFIGEKKINRIDSISIHYDLHPPCRKFRKDFSCETQCLINDDLHANIFRGLSNKLLENEVNKIIKNPHSDFHRQFRSLYSRNPIIDLSIMNVDEIDRLYIYYDCPILGYRELLFPIIIDGNVIGVLFVGELVLEDKIEEINIIRKNYFEKQNILSKTIEPEIGKSHIEFISNSENILSSEKYVRMIRDILIRITKLEKRLNEILVEKRIKYINEKIAIINQDISNNFSNSSEFGLINFWEKTTLILKSLSSAFPVESICVFGIKDHSSKPPNKINIQARYGEHENFTSDTQFILDVIPENHKLSPCSSIDFPYLLKGIRQHNLEVELDANKDLIRVIPTVTNPHIFLIVWVRYDDKIWPRLRNLERQKEVSEAFSTAIMGLYALLAFKFSALWAEIAQERLETIFRIMGHEIGQIIAEIDQNYWSPFNDYNFFRYIDEKKYNNMRDDFANFLRQLAALKYNSKYLIDEIEPKKKEFYIFDEILFKWRETYRNQANHKKITIKIPTTLKEDPLRPMVYADPVLIEQIVYNLLRNAIKYSYRGTSIYIDCFKPEIDSDHHILQVISYGIPILEEDSQKIYEIHERGSNTIQNDKSSQGLGLFLARKIILSHTGKISHTSTKISDYFIPFLLPYIENPSLKSTLTYTDVLIEFNRLNSVNYFNDCCAFNSEDNLIFYPSYRELTKKIRVSTYKNVFSVVIPLKKQ